MKLKKIIEYVDEVRPNAFSEKIKAEWLYDLEQSIQAELMKRSVVVGHVWTESWDGLEAVFESNARLKIRGELPIWPGGELSIAQAEGMEDNEKSGLKVLEAIVEHDSTTVIVAEGSFVSLGAAVVNLLYSGRDDEMLLPDLWKRVYYNYLEARVAAGQGEWNEYANLMQIYEQSRVEMAAWYCENYVDRR